MTLTKRPRTKAPKRRAKKRGPKPFAPTDIQRALVETHTGFGTPQEDICLLVLNPKTGRPIDHKTLTKAFAKELATGVMRANARVAESQFWQAVGRPAQFDNTGKLLRDEMKPNVTAGIFWLKARANWSDQPLQKHEHSGPEGGPIPVHIDSLTDSQLDQLLDRIEAAIIARAGR